MTLEWWHWLAAGLVLIVVEVTASGGFYFIFFGAAAIVVAALQLFDVPEPVWLQLLLFSILSVVSLVLFRNPLLRWMKLDRPARDVDSLVGEVGATMDDLEPGGVGRVELRGTVWTARNAGTAPLPRGRRCTVVRVERLMLFVTAEGVR
jgi:membrane protein implicated in regulation of membrane protease activity